MTGCNIFVLAFKVFWTNQGVICGLALPYLPETTALVAIEMILQQDMLHFDTLGVQCPQGKEFS
jgi:hypothetical protein